jgi:hypothetical protein
MRYCQEFAGEATGRGSAPAGPPELHLYCLMADERLPLD